VLLNDNKNAKIAFYNAYKIQPNNLLAIEELTKTSFDLGDFSDTVLYGNQYITANPNNENIHELVAYMCLINNDKKRANLFAKRGLNYFPANPNLNKIIEDTQ
jgi:Tfp pilus assembly protein PilF